MIIQHNLAAMTAVRYLNINQNLMSVAMRRLSTGLRINSAADDPAGLCISQKMEAQIRGLDQASRNVQNSISVLQVADGAMNETHSILQRMRELAVQSANGTYNDDDRKSLQLEFNKLTETLDSIAKDTNFNTIKLLDGSVDKMTVQAGPNSGEVTFLSLSNVTAKCIGIAGTEGGIVTTKDGRTMAHYTSGAENALGDGASAQYALDITNSTNAGAVISVLDDSIVTVSSARSSLGAQQNTLEYRIDYLDNAEENLTAAQSRIMDADMAKEMMNYAKYNILSQVTQAMLVQTMKQSENIIDFIKSTLNQQ